MNSKSVKEGGKHNMYSKSKRFIASFLAVLMAVCMLPVDMFGAVGVAYAAAGDIKATLTVDNETVQGTEIAAGKTASVSLSIEEGTGSEDIYYLIKKSDNGDAYSAIAADTARAKDGEGNFTDGAIKFDAASPITFTEATEFKAFTTKTVTETIDEVETEVIKYDKVATFPYTFETPGSVVPPVDPVAPAAPTADKTSVKAGDTITLSSADATAIYYVTSKDEKYADVSTGAISEDDLIAVKGNMTAGSSVTVPATVTEADGFKIKAFAEKTENEKSAQSEVVELTFTVTAAKVTLTADMITVGGTLEYDGTNAIATTAITVAVAKDDITYDKGNDYTYVIKGSSDTEVTSITAAGTYKVVVSVVETGRLAADAAVEKVFEVTSSSSLPKTETITHTLDINALYTAESDPKTTLPYTYDIFTVGGGTPANSKPALAEDGSPKVRTFQQGGGTTFVTSPERMLSFKINDEGATSAIVTVSARSGNATDGRSIALINNNSTVIVKSSKFDKTDNNIIKTIASTDADKKDYVFDIANVDNTLSYGLAVTNSFYIYSVTVAVTVPAGAPVDLSTATVSLKTASDADTTAYTGDPADLKVTVTKDDKPVDVKYYDVSYLREIDGEYVADDDITNAGKIKAVIKPKTGANATGEVTSNEFEITKIALTVPTDAKIVRNSATDIETGGKEFTLDIADEYFKSVKGSDSLNYEIVTDGINATSKGDVLKDIPSFGDTDETKNILTYTLVGETPTGSTPAEIVIKVTSQNYNDATFTITVELKTKTSIKVTLPTDKTYTYNGEAYDFATAAKAEMTIADASNEALDGDALTAAQTDLAKNLTFKFTKTSGEGENATVEEVEADELIHADTYTATATLTDGSDYSLAAPVTATFAIVAKNVKIQPKAVTWTKYKDDALKSHIAKTSEYEYVALEGDTDTDTTKGLVENDTLATQPTLKYYLNNGGTKTELTTDEVWAALTEESVVTVEATGAVATVATDYEISYEPATVTVAIGEVTPITKTISATENDPNNVFKADKITEAKITADTEVGNFLVTADAEHYVETQDSNVVSGVTKRTQTEDIAGNQFYHSIGFKTNGAATVTISVTSGKGSEARKLAISKLNTDNVTVSECVGAAITNSSKGTAVEENQTGTTYTEADKLYVRGSNSNHWNKITVKLSNAGTYYIYSTNGGVKFYEVSVKYDNTVVNPTPVEISGTVDTANLPAGATIVFVPAATATGATEATYDMASNKVSLLPNVVYTPEVRVGGTKDEDITVKVDGETTYSFTTAPTDPIAITFVAVPKYDITVPAVADLENVANIVTGSKGNAKAGETVKISDVITLVTPAEGYKQNGWEVKKTAGTGEAAKVELTNDPTNGWQFVMPGEAVTVTPVIVSENTVLAPTATPGTKDGSVAVASGTKVVLSAEDGNKIYYTIGADEANTLDPKTAADRKDYDAVKEAGGIEITEAVTIKAVALKGEDNYSEVVTYSYTITTAPSQVHELTKVEISGKAEVAQNLTAGLTFNPASDEVPTGTTVAYQWYRIENGTDTVIAGATSKTYTIMAIDKDNTIKVVVTYTDENGTVNTVSSAPTAVVTGSQGGSSDVPETGLAIKFDDGKTYIYTGAKITPSITVYNNGTPLVEGTDYTVKYTNNVNASHKVENDALTATQTNEKKLPTVTVTGKGSLSKKVTAYFNIVPKALDNEDYALAANADTVAKVSAGASAVASKKATPVLLYGGSKLAVKKNFVYDDTTQQNRTDWDGEAKLKLNGVSNFTGSVELTVNVITKADQANAKIKADFKGGKDAVKNLYYNGTPYVIGFDVSTKGGLSNAEGAEDALTEGTDYIISYPEELTNVGSKKVTITGISSRCTGSVTKTYKVIAANKNGGVFKVDGVDTVNGYDYVSTGVTFDLTGDNAVTVKYVANSSDSTGEKAVSADGESLVPGKDFKISYSNNKKVGTAKYTVTGLGNYKGVVLKNQEFTINPVKLIDGTNTGIDVTVADVFYNKSAAYKSVPYVTVNGKLLKASEYVAYYKVAGESETEIKGKTRKIADADFAESADFIIVTVRIEAKGKNVVAPAEGENALTKDFKIIKKDAYAKDKDLSKAKITFYGGDTKNKVGFTGNAVYPTKMDIKVGSATASVELDEAGQPKDKTTHKYTIVYADNIAKGKATAVVMADDDSDYVGGKAGTFNIVPKALDSLDTEHGEGFITSFMKGLLGK